MDVPRVLDTGSGGSVQNLLVTATTVTSVVFAAAKLRPKSLARICAPTASTKHVVSPSDVARPNAVDRSPPTRPTTEAVLLFRPAKEHARLGIDSIAVLVLYLIGMVGLATLTG